MKTMLRFAVRSGLLLGLCAGGILLAAGEGAAQPAAAVQASAQSGKSPRQAPVETVRRTRIRHGGLTLGGGYIHHAGGFPYFGYPYSWGYYDPFFPAFYHPGYFGGFVRGAGMGQVKLNVADKLAEVYLNDGYAGTVGELKSLWLEPGAYNLELRDPEGGSFQRRIYVLSGKTVRVTPEFAATDHPAPAQHDPEERP
jgi:hypothetical protein